jgi:hypothetical protein
VPSSTATDNDYLNYLKPKYPNGIVSKISVAKAADLQALINSTIAEETAAINKNVVGGMSNEFAKAMTTIYKKELATDNTQSIAIINANSAFKAVTSDTIDPANDYLDGFEKTDAEQKAEDPYAKPNIHNVNKLVIYDGTNEFTQNQTYKQMQAELKYRAEVANIPITKTTIINRTKGFK